MDINKCIYCGSEDIERGVKFLRTGSSVRFDVGPVYNTNDSLLGKVQECERTYVDICKSCGSLRLWIWDTNRDWAK